VDPNTLKRLEVSLQSLSRLVHQLDRELQIREDVVDVGATQAPVTERLHESVLRIGGVIPSRRLPHVVSARLSARFLTAVDRVTHITFDTAPNRVTARVAELAATRLGKWIRASSGATEEELQRMRRLRSRFVALRRTETLAGVSEMRPHDLMHRSLRLAPKYREVLALHALLRHED
jgi:hypothetical protein